MIFNISNLQVILLNYKSLIAVFFGFSGESWELVGDNGTDLKEEVRKLKNKFRNLMSEV
jgi:hypothetical protein